MKNRFRFFILISMFLTSFVSSSQQNWNVTSSDDNGAGTLRDILQQVENGDSVMFDSGIDYVHLSSGELPVTKSIVIIGNSEITEIIKWSGPKHRIFTIYSDDSLVVYFYNIKIGYGAAPDGTAASANGSSGGGIYIEQDYHRVYLEDCVITGNKAGNGYCNYSGVGGNGGNGGGIFSNSRIYLTGCEVTSNGSGEGCQWHTTSNPWQAYGTNGGNGAGIYVTNHLEMDNCLIEMNIAGNGGAASGGGHYSNRSVAGPGGSGGAIYCTDEKVLIRNCIFSMNQSGSGGRGDCQYNGIGGFGGHGGAAYFQDADVYIDSSQFVLNKAGNGGKGSGGMNGVGSGGGHGGAIFFTGSKIEISNSGLESNEGGSAGQSENIYYGSTINGGSGGGAFLRCDSAIINRTSFKNNIAGNASSLNESVPFDGFNGGNGGGLYIDSARYYLMISSSEFFINRSGNGAYDYVYSYDSFGDGCQGGYGGGICIMNGPETAIITNSLIYGNISGKSYLFEGMLSRPGKYPIAGRGGGIFAGNTGLNLINVTCAGNKTGISFYEDTPITEDNPLFNLVLGSGGGVYSQNVSQMINSILSDNTLADTLVSNDLSGAFQVSYSLVRDSSRCEISGNNNIFQEDPLFVNYPDSLMLSYLSPCVNSGDPDTSSLNLADSDLADNPRIFGGRIDMGAYELQVPLKIRDNKPGLVLMPYPNPADERICILSNLRINEEVKVQLADMKGQVIKTCNCTLSPGNSDCCINTGELRSGLYFVKVMGMHFEIGTRVLVMH